MPWNGTGTFSRGNGVHSGSTTWAQDAAAGTKIGSALHDTHDQDLATGINNCLAKDGQNSPTANIPMNSHKFTGLAVGSATGDSARYGQTITAAAINSSTNVLTLTRADGDITVDLTSIVIGGSFGNLTDKTVNETVTGTWTFQPPTIFQAFIQIGSGTKYWVFDYTDNYARMLLEAAGPGFNIDVVAEKFYYVDALGVQYEVWNASNFDPTDKADADHTHDLDDLSNVYIPSPSDGDVLQYSHSARGWVAYPLASLSGVVRTVTATAPVVAGGTATDVIISVPVATTSVAGLMSATDKAKLDGIATTPVSSFNGRTGAVTPAGGDYAIQQIDDVYVQNLSPGTVGISANAIWIKNGAPYSIKVFKSGAWQQVTADYP